MEQGISLVFLYTHKGDIQVSEEMNTSVEMPEVADPTETQSEEIQEVADPDEVVADEQHDETEDTENNEPEEGEEVADEQDKSDKAFAAQRRRIAELEKELEKRDQEAADAQREAEKNEQLRNIIDFAKEQGYTEQEINDLIEDVKADQEAEDERIKLQSEKEQLEDEVLRLQVEQMMTEDLKALQRIDPDLTDLDTLGEEFFALRSSGIEPVRAYHMIKTADEATKPKGAYAPGKLNKAKQESEYYTSEELDAMSVEEIQANWEKVQRSMNRLNKE
jgi:hypothetical protein